MEPVNPAADPVSILQLKVRLLGISPMVWRRVLVPESASLRELHGVVQVAMGWASIHLFEFTIRGSWGEEAPARIFQRSVGVEVVVEGAGGEVAESPRQMSGIERVRSDMRF